MSDRTHPEDEVDEDAVRQDHEELGNEAFDDKYGVDPNVPYEPVPGNPDDETKQ
jgi:hypothetical protein